MKASNHGRLPANARQIMYAARPLIIALTGKSSPWKHSSYFTQTLLPDFLAEHPDLTEEWDVVFDARGHFREPHTGQEIGLGTLEVREYLRWWTSALTPSLGDVDLPTAIQTRGPAFRYQYVLFVEKEGFDPLLRQAQMAERYDLGIMSTKGMTVTAARFLIERLSQAGVTILVLHDFDKSGLEILDKFTANTRRYQYGTTPTTVMDLGLRLADAQAMNLESERVSYNCKVDPRENLRRCGAKPEECAFLVQRRLDAHHWEGERVELNAMDSQQFLDWLTQQLQAVGVHKVVPDDETLGRAYQYYHQAATLQAQLVAMMQEEMPPVVVPDDLAEQLQARLQNKTEAWDEALRYLVLQHIEEQERETG